MKLSIVVPTYNEEKILEKNILKLYNFLIKNILDDWQIIIADNASTDQTAKIGEKLSAQYNKINYLKIKEKGKGSAIRTAWEYCKNSDIFIFMDADLATDLSALTDLINAISKKNWDIATGDRFHKKSKVNRGLKRKIISQGYKLLLKLFFKTQLSDLPCGFKAINKKTLENIVPLIKNNTWFFDSELLLIAEHKNYNIKSLPIIWAEDSRKKNNTPLRSIIKEYLKEMIRLRKTLKNM